MQYARPSADVTVGSWTTNGGSNSNLWAALDETSANDADFVQCALATNDSYEVRLSGVTPALIDRGHILRYRYQKGAAGGNTRGLTVELRQGSTVIASNSHPDATTILLGGAIMLTKAQGAAITNYDDLRVRFTATGSTSTPVANRRRVQVTWCQLRVPDADFGAALTLAGPPTWQYTLNGVTGEGPTREEALIDLVVNLRAINEAIETPDAGQLVERARLSRQYGYAYYAWKIKEYTTLRAQIVDGTYVLPAHQNIPEELVNLDEKLARFDNITSAADTQDGG